MSLITGRDSSITYGAPTRTDSAGGGAAGGASVKTKKWEVTVESAVKKAATSQSAGWVETSDGIHTWRGSFEISMEDGDIPDLEEGTLIGFSGYTDVAQSKGVYGDARVTSVNLPVEQDGPQLFATVNFEGDGPLRFV
jgi:hypothetical protein